MDARIYTGIFSGLMLLGLSACGPSMKEWQPEDSSPKIYSISFRQIAPEAVYRRTRWVHLPDVLPASDVDSFASASIEPIFHLQLRNSTLEEAAQALAKAAGYSSFCASTLAQRKISINSLGTLRELAAEIGSAAAIHAVVDETSRQVRFLASQASESAPDNPQFYNSATNESRGDGVIPEGVSQ